MPLGPRDREPSNPGRRAFLRGAGRAGLTAGGILAGLTAGGGFGPLGLFGRAAGTHADRDFRRTLTALYDDLSPAQRAAVCLPWDHPSRQMVGHVACLDVPRLQSVMTARQRALVHHLYDTLVAGAERRRFGRLVGLEGGGLDPCNVALYGDPHRGRCQLAISGGHLLMRGGSHETGAFGGPVAYGHQIGDGVPRLPGNAFAYHGDAANALFAALPAEARRRATVSGEPPFETAVQLQGAGGRFDGVPVRALAEVHRAEVTSLVETVLSCYDAADREAAWRCIRGNGGVDALHLAYWTAGGFYDDGAAFDALAPEERARRGDPYWHVWRVEGPGTLLHFRGWPHVHASIHVAADGGAGQHVGEVLGHAPRLLEGEPLRALLVDALRQETGEALAFYPGPLPARLPPGPLTAGFAWCLDPYRDQAVVAVLPGPGASAELRAALAAQGVAPDEKRSLRVAMPAFVATREDRVGEPLDVEHPRLGLRVVYERYFRRHGLSRLA